MSLSTLPHSKRRLPQNKKLRNLPSVGRLSTMQPKYQPRMVGIPEVNSNDDGEDNSSSHNDASLGFVDEDDLQDVELYHDANSSSSSSSSNHDEEEESVEKTDSPSRSFPSAWHRLIASRCWTVPRSPPPTTTTSSPTTTKTTSSQSHQEDDENNGAVSPLGRLRLATGVAATLLVVSVLLIVVALVVSHTKDQNTVNDQSIMDINTNKNNFPPWVPTGAPTREEGAVTTHHDPPTASPVGSFFRHDDDTGTLAPSWAPAVSSSSSSSSSPTITTSSCADDPTAVFAINGQDRNCTWLGNSTVFQSLLCNPYNAIAHQLCPATCGLCDGN